MTQAFDVNDNSEVYYSGTYWNSFEVVRRRLNRLISGVPTLKWDEHFANETGRTFKRALILNCGNGWVERELMEHGLIAEGVGMDYAQSMVDEATAAARAEGLPLTYVQSNVNDAVFPEGEFDLVVNHAAAHHIATLDRVFREICRVLPDDGWFVSYDYVGPHRNQWSTEAWEEVWALNNQIPASLRQTLFYPPVPLMLQVDPTEAIHSELIVDRFHRYFTTGQYTALGGAIAYPLLTHNAPMYDAKDVEEQTFWIERILEADARFLAEHPDSTLFAYFAGMPKKSVLGEAALLAAWSEEEAESERRARDHGGEYYDHGALAAAVIELDERRVETDLLQARMEALESQLRAMRTRYLYSRCRRLLDSPRVRSLRTHRMVAALERRIRTWLGA